MGVPPAILAGFSLQCERWSKEPAPMVVIAVANDEPAHHLSSSRVSRP